MSRHAIAAAALAALGAAAPFASAHAQTATGTLVADCDLNGAPGTLELNYETYAGAGVVYGPGVNPDIIGVIADGSSTTYWKGGLASEQGLYTMSGDSQFLETIPPGGYYSDHFLMELIFVDDAELILRANPLSDQPLDFACHIESTG